MNKRVIHDETFFLCVWVGGGGFGFISASVHDCSKMVNLMVWRVAKANFVKLFERCHSITNEETLGFDIQTILLKSLIVT